jgi:hypothetical protein
MSGSCLGSGVHGYGAKSSHQGTFVYQSGGSTGAGFGMAQGRFTGSTFQAFVAD